MNQQDQMLDWEEGDPWLMDEYGGRPITPRALSDGEDEDYARIGLVNYLVEPAVWAFAGYVLRGNAWQTIWDVLGYWMVLLVMLPLRLLDTDRPRDKAFHLQYIVLQFLTLCAGLAGWRLAGGAL